MPGIVGGKRLSGNLQSEYVFFDGERVARKDFSSNAVSYYFSDHLKTASVITDSTGNIKAESDYYPWGGELQLTANDSNHYKYGGHERDNETGCDYFGARYYCNGFSRFLSPDWSATPVPVPYADFSDPQSLNQYIYVGGNPASKADTDGHSPAWFQRLINKIDGDGWVTDAELTEQHRKKMINDATNNESFRRQVENLKPEEVDKLWNCTHNAECAAGLMAASKPVNLPAYKDVTVDVGHVRSGHTEGGSRVSPRKDLFPKGMSDKALESAIRPSISNTLSASCTDAEQELSPAGIGEVSAAGRGGGHTDPRGFSARHQHAAGGPGGGDSDRRGGQCADGFHPDTEPGPGGAAVSSGPAGRRMGVLVLGWREFAGASSRRPETGANAGGLRRKTGRQPATAGFSTQPGREPKRLGRLITGSLSARVGGQEFTVDRHRWLSWSGGSYSHGLSRALHQRCWVHKMRNTPSELLKIPAVGKNATVLTSLIFQQEFFR
jgi:RHS repeat-associated protein